MVIGAGIRELVEYARTCADEKGEAQVFCDRLFRAFGHDGYKAAGAVLEERVKMADGRTKFADLVWRPRLLIEMKKRGEKLGKHYAQAMQYWLRLTPNRPRYVVLCNFEEFWIYDFNAQLDEPMDRVRVDELPQRYTALNFLFPEARKPLFNNDRAAVTDAAAKKVGDVFRALADRGETRERAQRFTLQCVVAMFGEDSDLLPRGLFTELVSDCRQGQSSYDLIGALFSQMNSKSLARGGRYRGVRYFNGGIFSVVDPIELNAFELELLSHACNEDWSRINPAIFGTLFQASMEPEEQHRKGAHYTPEAEILRVVFSTVAQPWSQRIGAEDTLKGLKQLRDELRRFRVLDPACGSGNFLYVAYRELKRLELTLLEKIHDRFSKDARLAVGATASIQTKQFFGIDNDPFAVELAKVTLVLAKKLALDEAHHALDESQAELGFEFDSPLPLENLDDNIRCADALFCEWPKADAIIGNPPFQSKNKMQEEFGAAYAKRVRARYKDVPGRADYCVYWFRRAHDELPAGGRAGLVGTNTIRQNFSREGSLDYVVSHGGTIIDAVSTMVWRGRAVVHVSIVNWIKGTAEGKFRLLTQEGDSFDSPWRQSFLERIPSSLSDRLDVTSATSLRANERSDACFQGQTHGHKGFLLSTAEGRKAVTMRSANREVIFPYLVGEELVAGVDDGDWRYVIDFFPRDQVAARAYAEPFERVHFMVLPDREAGAAREIERNEAVLSDNPSARVNHHHANFLKRWWHLSYPRGELMTRLRTLPRYIGCSRVTKRPIFAFVSSKIHPSDVVTVFPLADDYSFGVLQSGIHWTWFKERCSTMKGDPRYTSESVFDSFPWPQAPSRKDLELVARAAVAVRGLRGTLMAEHKMNLRDLYSSLEDPGEHPLRAAQEALDAAVRGAYGMGKRDDALAFILALNAECAAREAGGEAIVGPGLPSGVERPQEFVTADCVKAPVL